MDIKFYNYKLSAGSGSSTFDEEKSELVTISKKSLESITKINHKDLVLFKVDGISMEPKISDGDTIIVDVSSTKVDKEGVFAFTWGEIFYIKLLQPLANELSAISLNPSIPNFTISLPTEEDKPLNIIGYIRGKAFEPLK